MENFAGWGIFTGSPHFGQLSVFKVYSPQLTHFLRIQTKKGPPTTP
jgi:hypothetical protein